MFAIPTIVLAVYNAIPSWLWKYLAIAAVAAGLYIAGDIHGKRIEKVRCEAAAQRAKDFANDQDNRAGAQIQTDDTQVTKELREQKERDDAEITTLRGRLAARPSNGCTLDNERALGLRY